MISPEIENRIVKFVSKSANAEDLHTLEEWILEPQNHSIFKEFVKTHFAITMSMSNPDSNEIRERLLKEIRKEKQSRFVHTLRSVLKYTAVIIFILGIGYFFGNEFINSASEVIVPKEEAITLQLENGNIKVIKEDGTTEVVDVNGNVVGTQEGTKLVYDKEAPIEKLVYNTLKVPHGKRFDVVLSDGTHVFLNAGTSIKYPIKFISSEKNRKVFLNGEAFFDVTKDEEHPFVVNAQALDVRVLGTKFNIATYEEDATSEVVLVEGSVTMNSEDIALKGESAILQPGFKGSYDKSEGTISTQKVNISLYTSWISGNVIFRNASFENITKKLERLYNVTIINNNEQLANESFNANIEVNNESIEQVLGYFNKVYQIEYTIVNNKIVIN